MRLHDFLVLERWREFDRASAEVVHGVDVAAGTSQAGTTIAIIATSPPYGGATPTNQVGTSTWQVGAIAQGLVRGTSTTGVTPGTITIDIRLDTTGGTLLATTGALTLIASQTTSSWELSFDIVCRSTGTAGTVMCMGRWTANTAIFAAGTALIPATAPATATMDTTISHSFVVCVTETQAGTSSITQQGIWVLRN